jgi:hypothetical protein
MAERAERDVLEFFAVRTAGRFQLMTDQGVVIAESATWRGLRGELDRILGGSPVLPINVTILVGRPQSRRPPARAPSPAALGDVSSSGG